MKDRDINVLINRPTTYAHIFGFVTIAIRNYKCRTILDLGCGFGTYAFLIRRYLEPHKFIRDKWIFNITGIDIHSHIQNGLNEIIYDDLRVESIINVKYNKYDLVLMLDVIEHLTKEEGLKIIKSILKTCKCLVVRTPYGWRPQRDLDNNIYNVHKSSWFPSEFMNIKKGNLYEINTTDFLVLLKGDLSV